MEAPSGHVFHERPAPQKVDCGWESLYEAFSPGAKPRELTWMSRYFRYVEFSRGHCAKGAHARLVFVVSTAARFPAWPILFRPMHRAPAIDHYILCTICQIA
jgi:hypothetical protein